MSVKSWSAACVLAVTAWCVSMPALGASATAAFMSAPRMSGLKVSPGNTHAAFRWGTDKGSLVLAVVDLSNPKDVRVVAGTDHMDVDDFYWVNDRRLVYEMYPQRPTIAPGNMGTFAVDIDGGRRVMLVSVDDQVTKETGSLLAPKLLPRGWSFHSRLAGQGDNALFMQLDTRDDPLKPVIGFARLDTATGSILRLNEELPPHSYSHVHDAQGRVRAAVSLAEGRHRLFHRPAGSDQWEQLEEHPQFDNAVLWPRYIEADGTWIVESRRGRDTDALFTYDPKTRRLDPEPLVAVSGFDIDAGLVTDPASRRLIGAHFKAAGPATAWFDERLARLQQQVDSALPKGRRNRLICGTCATAERLVVHSSNDRNQGEYFVFDGPSRRLTQLSQMRPGMPESSQGQRSFHRVPARDGLSLPVFVTHPRGVDAATPRPLVVLVHGGPWVRGASLAWDAEAQFLAYEGFRVLEVEYRGSTGFGERHFRAGWRQWGQAMQDDLADAVEWAVKEKMAEPGRACIVGGSYGGYAALMGPVRHPALYRCAASFAGVTDVTKMFNSWWTDISTHARRHSWTELVGDPVADRAMLEKFSPVNRVADIKVPVFVAWGERDRRVIPEHSTRFVAAARAAGVQVEEKRYPDGGHGLWLLADRVDHADRLSAFLKKHLGVAAEEKR